MDKLTKIIIRKREILKLPKGKKLEEFLINTINYFHRIVVTDISPEEYKLLKVFINDFLEVFSEENFTISLENFNTFITLNATISHITYISELKTTDKFLNMLLERKIFNQQTQVKILTLYSLRNTIDINYDNIFAPDKEIALSWYWHFFEVPDYISENNYQKAQKHINYIDKIENDLNSLEDLQIPYFFSTYIDPVQDKKVKQKLNAGIKKIIAEINKNIFRVTSSNPDVSRDKKKIAIISGNFFLGHSIHRCFFKFIKELKKDYELTLIEFGDPKNNDIDLFNEVINIKPNAENSLNIDQVVNKDFSMIFYPDLGMNLDSIIFSNLRIAPVQIGGYGHPVSTFGSEIDYILGGIDVEIISNYDINYSERLVLIPGIGFTSQWPDFKKNNLTLPQGLKNKEKFIILCPWTIQKINYVHLTNLKKIINRTNKNILFRFFPSMNYCKELSDNLYKDIGLILGDENIEIIKNSTYKQYMDLFEEGDICIDSFHFGGHNVLIDSLFLGKPFIAFEGGKPYNKFAAATLRILNLGELIADDYDSYLDKIVNIINNDDYRDSISKKINPENIENYFQYNKPEDFKKAFDYIIANNDKLSGEKEPIIITGISER